MDSKGKLRASRVAIGTGISAALMLALAGTASATTINWPGVVGTLNPSNNTLYVKDAACDDDSVYANWKTQGGQQQRLNNTSGCNTTSSGRIPMGEGTVILWRVCVDKSWPTSDDCSGWRSERI
jgi:hypothetical protein